MKYKLTHMIKARRDRTFRTDIFYTFYEEIKE
jgi:hypothetical protein